MVVADGSVSEGGLSHWGSRQNIHLHRKGRLRARDLGWKRKAYASLASLTRYLVISQDAVDVMVFARDDAFQGHRLRSLDEAIDLRSLGISLPVAEIYRDTGLT